MRMSSASACASSLFFSRRPSSTSRLNRHARPPRGLKLKCPIVRALRPSPARAVADFPQAVVTVVGIKIHEVKSVAVQTSLPLRGASLAWRAVQFSRAVLRLLLERARRPSRQVRYSQKSWVCSRRIWVERAELQPYRRICSRFKSNDIGGLTW